MSIFHSATPTHLFPRLDELALRGRIRGRLGIRDRQRGAAEVFEQHGQPQTRGLVGECAHTRLHHLPIGREPSELGQQRGARTSVGDQRVQKGGGRLVDGFAAQSGRGLKAAGEPKGGGQNTCGVKVRQQHDSG
jgi:hypothetical protein